MMVRQRGGEGVLPLEGRIDVCCQEAPGSSAVAKERGRDQTEPTESPDLHRSSRILLLVSTCLLVRLYCEYVKVVMRCRI